MVLRIVVGDQNKYVTQLQLKVTDFNLMQLYFIKTYTMVCLATV